MEPLNNIYSFFGLDKKDYSLLVLKRCKENIVNLVVSKVKEKYKTSSFFHTDLLKGYLPESRYINSFNLLGYEKKNLAILTSCDKLDDLTSYVANCYSHTSAHRSFDQRFAICLFINDFKQVIHNLRNIKKKYIFSSVACPVGDYYVVFMKKKLMPQDTVLLNQEGVEVFMSQLQSLFSESYINKRNTQTKFYVAVLLKIFSGWNIQDLTSFTVIGTEITVTGIPRFVLVYFDNVGLIVNNVLTINSLVFTTEIDLKNLIEKNELNYCTTHTLN
jgi:hypothetical protein